MAAEMMYHTGICKWLPGTYLCTNHGYHRI